MRAKQYDAKFRLISLVIDSLDHAYLSWLTFVTALQHMLAITGKGAYVHICIFVLVISFYLLLHYV